MGALGKVLLEEGFALEDHGNCFCLDTSMEKIFVYLCVTVQQTESEPIYRYYESYFCLK